MQMFKQLKCLVAMAALLPGLVCATTAVDGAESAAVLIKKVYLRRNGAAFYIELASNVFNNSVYTVPLSDPAAKEFMTTAMMAFNSGRKITLQVYSGNTSCTNTTATNTTCTWGALPDIMRVQ
jgi:hypothetical protein